MNIEQLIFWGLCPLTIWYCIITREHIRDLYYPRMKREPDPESYKPKPWWRKLLQAVSRRNQR